MDNRKMKEVRRSSPNFVLTFVIFCAVATAGFAYSYMKKPTIGNGNIIDVAITGFLVCGIGALFLFVRSLLTSIERPAETKEEGCYLPDEPSGC